MKQVKNLLSKNVIATLVFYDFLDWPLTPFEVYRYLIRFEQLKSKSAYQKIVNTLHLLRNRDLVEKERGFYCLEGRKKIIEKRIKKDKAAFQKWTLAQKRLSLLKSIPFVKAGFVSGSVGLGNVEGESDIDLLVVASRGHVWTVRFLLHVVFASLGWRRKGEDTKNKVCLYHFLETRDLELPSKSIYNAEIHAHFLSFYDRKDYTKRFCRQNSRANPCLNNAFPVNRTPVAKMESKLQLFLEWLLGGFLGRILEIVLGWLQRFKIKKTPERGDEHAYVENGKLAFHPLVREEKLRKEYKKRIKQLGL